MMDTPIGIIIAKVPQDVPVANAIAQANKNKISSIVHNGTRSWTNSDKNIPVSNCSITSPTDQAKIKISTAVTILPTPLKNTGTNLVIDTFFLGMYKIAALIIANIQPHTNDITILPSPVASIIPVEEVKNPSEIKKAIIVLMINTRIGTSRSAASANDVFGLSAISISFYNSCIACCSCFFIKGKSNLQ